MTAGRLAPAALLFDLDGTLADSFAGIRKALNRALAEAGLPAHDLDWVRRHVGRGAAALVRDAAGPDATDAVAAALRARFERVYEEIFLAETPAYPDVAEVLASTAGRTGGRVAVISNKYEPLSRALLAHWGVAGSVAAVVGPDTFGVRKPDPGTVLPVLAGFGVAPGDALLVGDMEVDAATGRAAGVPVVGVRGESTTPEALRAAGMVAVLDRLGDLPAWLAENGTGWGYH
ncbi:MAG TPA: HAD hydrolase-like protein [Thermoanaerobaculaceae bacterium]|nr:HAD hydrolase-like protein [Thermoanaerobaculaceae bacterium]